MVNTESNKRHNTYELIELLYRRILQDLMDDNLVNIGKKRRIEQLETISKWRL